MPNQDPVSHRSGYPEILSRLRDRIDFELHRVSDYLSARASGMSRRKLRGMAILGMASWFTICIVMIRDGVTGHARSDAPGNRSYSGVIRHTPPSDLRARAGPSFTFPSRAAPYSDSALSRAERHIRLFQHYLDSLRQRDPHRYLDILHARRGLIDSLDQIEDIFFTLK